MSENRDDSTRLMPAKRRLEISALFTHDSAIRIEELADRFGVSRETIRRDLIFLEGRGLVERVHGGGIGLEVRSREPTYDDRVVLLSAQKESMGKTAGALIGDAESVFLDVGTSVAVIADNIPPSFAGQIFTNSIIAASRLDKRGDLDVIICGGRMRHGDLALSGSQTAEFLRDVFVEIAFLGCGGVHSSHGITDFYLDEISLKKIVIENSTSTYVLADSSKIGWVATNRVCTLDQVTGIITDEGANPELVSDLRSLGVKTYGTHG